MHLAAALLAAALSAGPVPASAAAPARHHPLACSTLPVIAHRGVHGRAITEDTTASFAAAVAQGADVVEGDLRLSADGTWVLMHDGKINRTTHSRGRVAQLSDAQLAGVQYNDGRVGVSRLQDALVPLTASPATRLQIELKPPGVDPGSLRRLVDLLRSAGLQDRTVVTSYHKGDLAGLHAVDPAVPTALVTTHAPPRPGRLLPYGTQLDLQEGAVSRRVVKRLHRVGIRVQPWTVDSRGDLQRVVRDGVDAIVTNHVARIRRLCGR